MRQALAAIALAAAAALALWPEPALGPPLDRVPARAQAATAPPERIIVRFEPGADRGGLRREADVTVERALPLEGLQVVRPSPGRRVEQAVAALNRARGVRYAEPDFPRRALAIPDDPLFAQTWGLHNTAQPVGGRAGGTVDADIDAPEAWDVTTGSAGVAVAILDTGIDAGHRDLAPNLWRNPGETPRNGVDDDRNGLVDAGHRDLAPNLWRNPGETPRNGVDDDRNGLVDDAGGWDFVEDDPDPQDPDGHGTHVAGTIGARGNDGFGVAGVAWRTSLVPLRVLGADGAGTVSDAIDAYLYAARMNLRVANLSLGGTDFSRAERDVIASASQTLVVTAAGNDGADNDRTGSFPCNYDLPNVVCVAATDRDGALAPFSNLGATTVDLAAPGTDVASTYPGGGHALLSGTSMAAPHVSGAAALVWAREPAASVAQVREALTRSVTPAPSLTGTTVTGGTLNAAAALGAVPRAAPATPSPSAAVEAPVAPLPAPAPAIAPGAASDTAAPRIAIAVASRIARRTAAGRGLRVRVRCSEACALRAELRHGRVLVGRGRGGRSAAGSATLAVRLTASGSRRLRRRVPERVTLVLRAVDPAGNARTARRAVTLRR